MSTYKVNGRVPSDIKKQILQRVKQERIPVSQIAKDHGLSDKTIYGWLGSGATGTPTWGEYNKIKKENRELKELLGLITHQMSVSQKKI